MMTSTSHDFGNWKSCTQKELAEQECEQLYQETYSKYAAGRFLVKIPFKKDEMGPSRLCKSVMHLINVRE